jgi:hypothetical protein
MLRLIVLDPGGTCGLLYGAGSDPSTLEVATAKCALVALPQRLYADMAKLKRREVFSAETALVYETFNLVPGKARQNGRRAPRLQDGWSPVCREAPPHHRCCLRRREERPRARRLRSGRLLPQAARPRKGPLRMKTVLTSGSTTWITYNASTARGLYSDLLRAGYVVRVGFSA